MAHISRPYQIALVALLVLALAWFAVGMHHSPSSASTEANSPSQASTTHTSPAASNPNLGAEEAKSAATPTPIYHGAAPGLEGLSRAISKAHEAVATSQANANTLAEKSAQASGESTTQSSQSTAGASATAGASTSAASAPASSSSAATKPTAGARSAASTGSSTSSAKHAAAAQSAAATHSSSASRPATGTHSAPAKVAPKRSAAEEALVPAGQRAVEAALAAGKVPVVLFWNPEGADDIAVHGQLQQINRGRLPVELFEGNAEAVASYGALTRQVPVYGTPTILIVAKNGQTTELTGLQERFSIEQAIEEARRA